jgi:predicted ATP-grasp superfamily ATP-dependent carboligase
MVEFRRDRHGQAALMEVNPRMGGSVALAVAAGIDFPLLLLDWKLGRELHESSSYTVGKRLRWLPGDIRHLKCAFDSPGRPDVPARMNATAHFLADFVRPHTEFDVFEWGDLQPALSEMNRIVWLHAKHRLRRSRPVERLAALAHMD